MSVDAVRALRKKMRCQRSRAAGAVSGAERRAQLEALVRRLRSRSAFAAVHRILQGNPCPSLEILAEPDLPGFELVQTKTLQRPILEH